MADRPSEWRQSLEEDHMSVEREEGLIPGVCNHPHAACPAADLLGGEDVARIAIAAGFSGEALITAVALAKAESTWGSGRSTRCTGPISAAATTCMTRT